VAMAYLAGLKLSSGAELVLLGGLCFLGRLSTLP